MAYYRILIVDDIPETAFTTAEFLHLHGFETLVANDPPTALRLLKENRIHLVLLDLCLKQDGDPTDGGLDLAQQIDPAIPKIIMTKFPSFETLYDARVDPTRAPRVVDYVLKALGQDVLLERVRAALATYAPINWGLQIRWSERQPPWQRLSLPRLVELIEERSDTPAALAQELEELLRMLFRTCDEIVCERALGATPGRATLEVRTSRKRRVSGHYLVVYGVKARVQAYEQRRQEYAPRDGEARILHPELRAETGRFAAVAYLVSGMRLAASMTLGEFYRSADAAAVTVVLEDLLGSALRFWYTRASITENFQATAHYYRDWLRDFGGTTRKQSLRRRIQAIAAASLSLHDCPMRVNRGELVLHLSDGTERRLSLPPDGFNVEFLLTGSEHLVGLVNGAFDRDPVLVDPERRNCALVEFEYATLGPLCADYAALEHWLRLQLSPAIGLATRLRCEEVLRDLPGLTATPELAGMPPEAQKLMRAIARVRYLAGTTSPARDLRSYQAALFFAALRHLLRRPLPPSPDDPATTLGLAHSLICVALLYRCLTDGRPAVTLDRAQRTVSIYGRAISLPPQLFRLFEYLYDRRGKVCSKRDLLREALDMRDINTAEDIQRNQGVLQNLVSRLREAIEPDPDRPIYLLTVRALGYRLDLPAG